MATPMSGSLDPTAAANHLAARLPASPDVMLVLGSGMDQVVSELDRPVVVPFSEVPGLPATGVAGHTGRYLGGLLEGRMVLVQAGRFHLYEGHTPVVVVAPVRVALHLGVRTLLLTNAAGGIHRALEPGTLMLLDDHLDLTWRSVLAGPLQESEERFPDMSSPYDPELQNVALRAALELGMPLSRGVYAAVAGPSYETPAEVRALERFGADAVGMSTVPEIICARALGIRCLALSLIANRAASTGGGSLSHAEVLSAGSRAAPLLGALLARIVRDLPR